MMLEQQMCSWRASPSLLPFLLTESATSTQLSLLLPLLQFTEGEENDPEAPEFQAQVMFFKRFMLGKQILDDLELLQSVASVNNPVDRRLAALRVKHQLLQLQLAAKRMHTEALVKERKRLRAVLRTERLRQAVYNILCAGCLFLEALCSG